VNLQLLRNGEKVDQVVYGRDYTLRADMSHPDGKKERRKEGRRFVYCLGLRTVHYNAAAVGQLSAPTHNHIA
jgi:hypothetical protein